MTMKKTHLKLANMTKYPNIPYKFSSIWIFKNHVVPSLKKYWIWKKDPHPTPPSIKLSTFDNFFFFLNFSVTLIFRQKLEEKRMFFPSNIPLLQIIIL